jgi:hypothetical protein
MPTAEPSALLSPDEEQLLRREHNRIVQAIIASRGARPDSVYPERPEDPSQAFSIVSEESVETVSDDDSQEGEGTSLKWELITNKLLTAWELDNRKIAIQTLRTY